MCPLGLWPHQVSLLSWGSAGWTPPSRMPSSSWDYIQLPRPTFAGGGLPTAKGPWLGTSRGPAGLTFPSCPPRSSSIWQLFLWLPPAPPGSACQIRPVCPSLCPLLWVQDPLPLGRPLCLTRWFPCRAHTCGCLRAALPTSHLHAFSLSPAVQEGLPPQGDSSFQWVSSARGASPPNPAGHLPLASSGTSSRGPGLPGSE